MKQTTIKAIGYLLAGAAVLCLLGQAHAHEQHQVFFQKPLSFSVEPWSFLRSQDLKPERAAPVVYEGLIYAASSRKKLAAFDLSGKRVSELDLKFAPAATPLITNGKIYVGGDDGIFHCLDLKTGKEAWSHDLRTLDFSAPAAARGNVIFQTAQDRVMALDLETGQWRWEYQHLRGQDLAINSFCPPAVKQGIVYIGFSGGAAAALDALTGRLIWKKNVFSGEQFQDVNAPLVVDDTSVYAVSASGRMAALSRKTGKVFWRYAAGGMAGCALEGDTIYLATDEAELIAINKITGIPAWSAKLTHRDKLRFLDMPTTALVTGNQVVTVSRFGRLNVLDKNTGDMLSIHDYYTSTHGPVVAVNHGGFMFMDNKGIIRLWIPKNKK